MTSTWIVLSILLLPVGVVAGDYCTPAAWRQEREAALRWERAAAMAEIYARQILEGMEVE